MPVNTITFNSDSYTGGSVPEASFDASLYKSINRGFDQLKLTIKVRIKLRQLPSIPIPVQPDHNGKPFWTSPWNDTDWQRFIRGAVAQADMWNNKFWLLPPTYSEFDWGFDAFDVGLAASPNQAWRPNIRCALDVDFDPKGDAHRTINVANLNMNLLLLERHGQPPDAGTFRSDALLYDSLDAVPWVFPYGPGPDQPRESYVIAHEIGHAIGLGHIGTILKTPLCELAINLENVSNLPPALKGGRDSAYCYGFGQGIEVVGNIMGAGDRFTVDNATPWLWAIGMMRNRPWEFPQWRVVTNDPGPGRWVNKATSFGLSG